MQRKEKKREKSVARTRIPMRNGKRAAVQTAVLRTLYAGSMLTIAILAPKATRYLPHPDGSKTRRVELYRRIQHAKASLKHQGFVEETADGKLRLTKRGTQSIERVLMREYAIPEQVRWDGKWRVLIFDVREKRRRTRNALRALLSSAGFMRLQDSVWVYPYPCDEFVQLLRAHLKSGVGELRQITADALESDRALREHFSLA